jgi:mitochondrial fission protein ELM1
MKFKDEIHVVCFLDGRPGHEKQSMGIIRALGEKTAVKVTDISLSDHSVVKSVSGLFRLFFSHAGSFDIMDSDPDLVIGTGSRTHLHVLLFKKQFNIPAITCMAPDRIYRKWFDLCFVPAHDGLGQAKNIVTTLGPPNCSVDRGEHRAECGLVLLGGVDEKSHRWDSKEVFSCLKKIIKKNDSMQWVISSSPRTPAETVRIAEELAEANSSLSFFRYEDTPPGWVERQYDISSVVWVTEDSVSMIHEALTAGCRVGVLPVRWKKKNNKFKKSIAFLEDKGFVLLFENWVNGNTEWPVHENFNEARRCADIILRKWWPRNLQ